MATRRDKRIGVRPRKRDAKAKFDIFGVDSKDHSQFKQKLQNAARTGLLEFPSILRRIKDLFRAHDPRDIMAPFACYGLVAGVTERGIGEQIISGVKQQDAEMLQAIMLALPKEEWGHDVLMPDVTQEIFDIVPKLSEAFFFQRILDTGNINSEEEFVTLSLQERVRMYTHGVRNWGYYSDVVRLTKELFGPLDPAFKDHYGFAVSDLMEILRVLVVEFERRQNDRWTTLRKIFRGANVRQIVRLYYRYVPDLADSPEEMLSVLPKSVTRDQIKALVLSHFDLRLPEIATFKVAEISLLTDLLDGTVERILKAISLKPGSLAAVNPEHLFLANPVWEKPVIDLGEAFFVPIPQMAFSHIYRIMDRLFGEVGLKEQLSARRAKFLQFKLEEVFRGALPDADMRPAAKWTLGDKQFETDLLVIVDRTVVIAEAKSNWLTPEGLRGAPGRVRRHVSDLVLDPSMQSARLEALICAARGGDKEAARTMSALKINPACVDQIIRISVTLDDFSVLTVAEEDFKKIGWVPSDHALAPALLISDLESVADVLGNPLLFLHYLSERSYFQRSFNLLGSEMDFLGLYLTTAFNVAALTQHDAMLVPTGMSVHIDKYYNSRDAGVTLPKPSMAMTATFAKIVDRLVERRPIGWTTIGMHLLSCMDPAEQAAVERSLIKLRGMVRKNYREVGHTSSIRIHPPGNRKAIVILYVFPERHREIVRPNMKQLAAEALAGGESKACVVFARCIESWERPYDTVLLAQHDGH